ncbi:MAG: phytanoyl-CoA dioxygenase family protein [Chloroflexi bacterium]|nr:phytanoyl-CoA dioxygenase family protein [Chloroflexota bacterium]
MTTTTKPASPETNPADPYAGVRPNGALGVLAVADGPPRHGTGRETIRPDVIATDFSATRARYVVSVEEYVRFHEQGFLVVRGLLNEAEIGELREHGEDLMHGRVAVPGIEPPTPGMTLAEIERRYLRIHMLHRHLEIEERYLLHPRMLDVLEALIGPDLLALQTMYFIKAPGGAGQGYHQDSYYIPTYPDSLCGAWIAIDRADEANGCVWFTVGSQHEPIYPTDDRIGQNHTNLGDLAVVANVSHTDEEVNTLSRIAAKYAGREVAAVANPGDAVFFAGHVLHRSHTNHTNDRFRRSLVCHYANARSFTAWGNPGRQEIANGLHILARGATHLPFAEPRFGTPCAANSPVEVPAGGAPLSMMADGDDMRAAPQDVERNDPTMMRAHDTHTIHG